MTPNNEVEAFLRQHLETIRQNDLEGYRASTSPDLTLYEWWITPHRIDGLPFHEFMMTANAAVGTVFGSAKLAQSPETPPAVRFDLSNLYIQRHETTAIASYTLLISSTGPQGVTVTSHNETRVMIQRDGNWQVVHVHKSPAWQAPHWPQPPAK